MIVIYYVPRQKRLNLFKLLQKKKGVNIDEETWALSELIQWLFRSAIREENEINIYIPSKRMRSLLQEWLEK